MVFDFYLPMKCIFITGCLLFTIACSDNRGQSSSSDTAANTVVAPPFSDSGSITPQAVVAYATTLVGTPYKYASTNPQEGFDCSGFITYVFSHFNIAVPRSSVEFANAYPEVDAANAKQGDLVLFTGTDSTDVTVGHMGIIVSNSNDSITFIHSSSGKANGVTVTPLNAYYKSRFVKIVRVLQQNDSLK